MTILGRPGARRIEELHDEHRQHEYKKELRKQQAAADKREAEVQVRFYSRFLHVCSVLLSFAVLCLSFSSVFLAHSSRRLSRRSCDGRRNWPPSLSCGRSCRYVANGRCFSRINPCAFLTKTYDGLQSMSYGTSGQDPANLFR